MTMFKKNGGFTLVELIVVIAILAILAGVAIPAYSGYIKKAQDVNVVTELDAIQTAAQAANATNLEKITTIAIASDGKTITFTGLTTDEKAVAAFESDFKTFYGELTKVAAGKYTLSEAIKFEGTSYVKGATWNATGDNAGWSANK